jgi:hypothetical protein
LDLQAVCNFRFEPVAHTYTRKDSYALGQIALFLRADSSCGSFRDVLKPAEPFPDKHPSSVREIATLPQSALNYRRSGNDSPIHVDPNAAGNAGFEHPIPKRDVVVLDRGSARLCG